VRFVARSFSPVTRTNLTSGLTNATARANGTKCRAGESEVFG
jgi:hypothetical protein